MYSKGFTLAAILLIGFVLVANVRCAPEQVEPESLPIRVRRQLPGIPQGIPGVPDASSIPGVGAFKNAGSGLAKNIPGADNIPGLPRATRSAPVTGAPDTDSMMTRMKREARGTGNLPTKTG